MNPDNQICITCRLSIADAVAAGVSAAGTFQISLRDLDVAQIRDQGLIEVALPFLGTRIHPSRIALTLHGMPDVDVDVQLRALRDQLARVRGIAKLAERPSWDTLTALAAHDPDDLTFPLPPTDVAVDEREREVDELGMDATTASALVMWARRVRHEVASYEESIRSGGDFSMLEPRRCCIVNVVQRAPSYVCRCSEKTILDWLPSWLPSHLTLPRWLPGHLMQGDATPGQPQSPPPG